MEQIIGKYQLEKQENIDEYFKAIGVPYIARKMIGMSSPTMEISQNNDEWTIKTISMLRTLVLNFKFNEEYDETMPGGTLKTTTKKDGDKFISTSIAEDGTKITRVYDFDDSYCTITFNHEKSGQVAKRYFKRV